MVTNAHANKSVLLIVPMSAEDVALLSFAAARRATAQLRLPTGRRPADRAAIDRYLLAA